MGRGKGHGRHSCRSGSCWVSKVGSHEALLWGATIQEQRDKCQVGSSSGGGQQSNTEPQFCLRDERTNHLLGYPAHCHWVWVLKKEECIRYRGFLRESLISQKGFGIQYREAKFQRGIILKKYHPHWPFTLCICRQSLAGCEGFFVIPV